MQLPVSWLRCVRLPGLTTEGVSTSQCLHLIYILTDCRNNLPLCNLGACNLTVGQHFRLATAGPFPFETLGWVSRRNRSCDQSLLWPSCGSQPVSSFSSLLSQRVLRTQARAIQGHRLEFKHNKAGVSRCDSGGPGSPPSKSPGYATHAGPKPNTKLQ
jgi:hypothetical protein